MRPRDELGVAGAFGDGESGVELGRDPPVSEFEARCPGCGDADRVSISTDPEPRRPRISLRNSSQALSHPPRRQNFQTALSRHRSYRSPACTSTVIQVGVSLPDFNSDRQGPGAGSRTGGRTGSAGEISPCLDEMQSDGRYPIVGVWVTRKRLGCGGAAPAPVVRTSLGG